MRLGDKCGLRVHSALIDGGVTDTGLLDLRVCVHLYGPVEAIGSLVFAGMRLLVSKSRNTSPISAVFQLV